MIWFKFVSVFLVSECVYGAKILGIFHLDWGSHYILGSKLMRGLAEAGHEVTFVSPHKYKNPPNNGSWTDIVLDGLDDELKALLGRADFFNGDTKTFLRRVGELLVTISNYTLFHPNVHKLIKSDETFDVVIIEQVMNDCHHAFSYHFKCPLIVLNSIGPNQMINSKVGNPSGAAINPTNEESKGITFMQRLKSLYYNISVHLLYNFLLIPRHNHILHSVFPEAPDIYDLYYNVSLVLLNSHHSLTDAVPLVPNMVEVGGYFIDPPQKLPNDLQDFLDSATDGAIYFSMGSQLKSTDMMEEKKNAILGVFKKLKQKVMWKFEEDLPEKPDNVLIRNWLPQQDILAHPNIKLFINQAGLLSTIEAIYHGVPVLAIPVFGDQSINAKSVVQNGFGLKLAYSDTNFNEETLNSLIQELLNNSKYRENAQVRSKIYHDRPMTPMESAVYWVEYIIRHNGAPHLRVAGVGMPWYKYYMIDVITVLIVNLFLVVLCMKCIFKKISFGFRKRSAKSIKLKMS